MVQERHNRPQLEVAHSSEALVGPAPIRMDGAVLLDPLPQDRVSDCSDVERRELVQVVNALMMAVQRV